MPSTVLDFSRSQCVGENQLFLSCPECGADHNAATMWGVKAIGGDKAPIITALVCPSCEYKYQVFNGEVREAANNQLRIRPARDFWFLVLLSYLGAIGTIALLWKAL